jgi:hypothetical protein
MKIDYVCRWMTPMVIFASLHLGMGSAWGTISEDVIPPGDEEFFEIATEQPEETKPKVEIKGAVAIGTDIRVRGLSFTDGGTSVVGMLHLDYNNFYATLVVMNADLGTVVDTSGNSQDLVTVGLTTSLGYKTNWGKVDIDVGASFYAFPGAFDNQDFLSHDPILGLPEEIPLGRANFFEVHLEISGKLWKTMQASFAINWTPEYLYESGENWAFESNFNQLLLHKGNFTLLGVGELGYNTGDFLDYWYYNVGLAMVYKHHYVVDVRYNDTFSLELDCSLTKVCGSTVVFRGSILF